jgi:uncharacterized protein
MSLEKIFKKNKNLVIGAIHFPPLLGYEGFPGYDVALKNALKDLRAFEDGGADAIIFENNYDIPHKILVDAQTVVAMTFLGKNLREATSLPMGISVLWNDYRAALSIAKTLGLQFIRIPVFVDEVETDYGIVIGEPKKVIYFRKSIGAENVALFTDIHVKHAKLLSKRNLLASAKLAIKNGSDALIVTGKWTGDAPSIRETKMLRECVGKFPILVGSGCDRKNAKELYKFANGAIVSTSLKNGRKTSKEINTKPYAARINGKKVRDFIKNL